MDSECTLCLEGTHDSFETMALSTTTTITTTTVSLSVCATTMEYSPHLKCQSTSSLMNFPYSFCHFMDLI